MHWKNTRSRGKIGCVYWHPKVPIGTLRVPIGTPYVLIGTPRVPIGTRPSHDLNTLFCVFGHFKGLLWFYFSLQKIGWAITFLKNLHGLSNQGILTMYFPFFKNYHLHHLFQKEKRKLSKPRIFKIMHLFSKLGEFGYTLSPFLRNK